MPQSRSYFKSLLTSSCIVTALIFAGCAQNADSQVSTTDKATATKNTPKNIIVFIGDGMGVSTVTAGRIFDGQSQGKMGEEHYLAFEEFDNVAMIKTYNTNSQVPDSAGTATAILSGYKTNIGAVNVKPNPDLQTMYSESCSGQNLAPTLTDKAKAKNKAVGIISTARLTHATPAAMYSHSASRNLEADKDIVDEIAEAGCKSISTQFISSNIDLALGGGRKEFTDAQVQTWQDAGHIYVDDKAALDAAPTDKRLLGLFNASHMSFEADREGTNEPSLAHMTDQAISRLSQDEDGYVLMVEAGRVDHAHHGSNAYRALTDMQALNEAVKMAKEKTGEDTLIVVTADHSHVFVMQGYPTRGNPILGLVRSNDMETSQPNADYSKADDEKPYTTLGYYNGPNQRTDASDALTDNMVQAKDYRQQTAVPMGSETHAGEDVPLYATGPGAHHFKGVMDQDEIGQTLEKLLKP